jgi:hypothetical protein
MMMMMMEEEGSILLIIMGSKYIDHCPCKGSCFLLLLKRILFCIVTRVLYAKC